MFQRNYSRPRAGRAEGVCRRRCPISTLINNGARLSPCGHLSGWAWLGGVLAGWRNRWGTHRRRLTRCRGSSCRGRTPLFRATKCWVRRAGGLPRPFSLPRRPSSLPHAPSSLRTHRRQGRREERGEGRLCPSGRCCGGAGGLPCWRASSRAVTALSSASWAMTW